MTDDRKKVLTNLWAVVDAAWITGEFAVIAQALDTITRILGLESGDSAQR